jgi:TIR domain
MIFVSHNKTDKPVVEQFAIRLAAAFGKDKVFYDSWSIQPGDGIVGKMNEALVGCKFFFFFISKHSLCSEMVKLEWQNAIVMMTRGATKFVPIKLDNSVLPPILLQSLYIDLYSNGIDVALRQVIEVATGTNTFQPIMSEFSNLQAYFYVDGTRSFVEIRAEQFMEPISHFLVLVDNAEGELEVAPDISGMFSSGYAKSFKLIDGRVFGAYRFAIERATVPGHPFVIQIDPKSGAILKFAGVMHEKTKNVWRGIPVQMGRPSVS